MSWWKVLSGNKKTEFSLVKWPGTFAEHFKNSNYLVCMPTCLFSINIYTELSQNSSKEIFISISLEKKLERFRVKKLFRQNSKHSWAETGTQGPFPSSEV